MTNYNTLENLPKSRILPIACAVALGMAFTVSLAHADSVTPPDVPGNIMVPLGNEVF